MTILLICEALKLTETLYVTGVVIANGIPDSQDDCLNKQEIKTIFTKYLNRDTDVMHNRIRNDGVDVLANWISEVDTNINGKTAPAGSWLATFAITNPDLIKAIESGEANALSLGSTTTDGKTPQYWFINKSKYYRDLKSIEDVNPLFISFVDDGANGFTLEVLNRDEYINKSKNGDKMTETKDNSQDMVSISALGKIRDLFINKNDDEKPEQKPEEKPEPETKDITNQELLEQLPDAIVSAFKEAFKKEEKEKEKEDETKVNKKDDETEETESSEKPEDKEDETKIDKRSTHKPETITVSEPSKDFYTRTGRDHMGRKIR